MNLESAESKPEASEKYFFRASADGFGQIPGSPIAYWLPRNLQALFMGQTISENYEIEFGIKSGDNARFLRYWHEVRLQSTNIWPDSQDVRYIKHNKGGEYRRWYGNCQHVIDWSSPGQLSNVRVSAKPESYHSFVSGGVTWSEITSGRFSTRLLEGQILSNNKGPTAVSGDEDGLLLLLALTNTNAYELLTKVINPTLSLPVGDFGKLPIPVGANRHNQFTINAKKLVGLSKVDWDSFEYSWDYKGHPLLAAGYRSPEVAATYKSLRDAWRRLTLQMQSLEEENNHLFNSTHSLQGTVTDHVPLNEISLTCNPQHRYGGKRSEEELEALLLADTMREFISYAVGCMFGRYSLDEPGLILANQGESVEDYLKRVPEPTFAPDVDNVIPFLDSDWFADDVTERFKEFLRVTFGAEHYEENLRFIEDALNVKGRRSYSIRDFFLNEFYDDHVRRYKKRPIYWMFSSPKGSFRALIYMHRYRPDTVSVVLNNYLREFRTKLVAQRDQLEAVSVSTGSSPAEKTRALRDLDRLLKVISELEDYEHDVLYPLAAQQVEIDLDDGVKVNYPKFGSALRKIPGL